MMKKKMMMMMMMMMISFIGKQLCSIHPLRFLHPISPVLFTFRRYLYFQSSFKCIPISSFLSACLMDRDVLTTYLLYINVISQSGNIEERVISIQTVRPLSVLSKGETTLYLGEGDSMEVPLSFIYGGDENGVTASVQILSGKSDSLLSNQTGIPLSPHSGTKRSISFTVCFYWYFFDF